MMDKSPLLFAFVALGIVISSAYSAPSPSTAFEEWLSNFEPSNERATKSIDCAGKPNDFYANEPDTCSATYYACVLGVAYLQTCPAGQVFDSPSPPATKGCKTRQLATSSACRTYPPPFCNATNEGTYQPIEECGDFYYICIQGNINFQRCQAGYVFDPVTLICIDNTGPNACTKVTTEASTVTTSIVTSTEASTTSAASTLSTSARPLPTAPCYNCGITDNTSSMTAITTNRPLLPTAPCTACSKIGF